MTDKEKQQIADALITASSTLYMCESWANNQQHLLQVSNARKSVDNALNKFNPIPAEHTSEDLEKAATALTNEMVGELNIGDYTDHSGHNAHWHSFKEGVIAGANWQKKQDKALIERAEDHAKLAGIALGEKEAKEKFINKACEWLVDNVNGSIYYDEFDNAFIDTDELVTTFKHAMEE